MYERPQTITVDPTIPFSRMAEAILREWTQDEPTKEQIVVLGDIAYALARESWEDLRTGIALAGIQEPLARKMWNLVVLDSWNVIAHDFFQDRFRVISTIGEIHS